MGLFRHAVFGIVCLLYIFLFPVFSFSSEGSEKPLKIWYSQPARIWEEALPLGNGHTGAMVFGGVQQERYQLNDNTLWSGGPAQGNNPEAAALLPAVRAAIFRKDFKTAEEIWRKMQGPYSARYLPLGDLRLDFDVDSAVTDYVRALDISEAVATVEFKSQGVSYRRTAFISHPAKVLVVRLTADRKGKLNLRVRLDSKLRHQTKALAKGLLMEGQAPFEVAARDYFPQQIVYTDEGIRFAAQVGVRLQGGRLVREDSNLRIEGADEVELYLSESTDFTQFDEVPGAIDATAVAEKRLGAAMKQGWTKLWQEHTQDYKKLFERASLRLDGGGDYHHLSTDERLKQFKVHTDDLSLQELYYQFGRYLLIASSRAGGRPANLQGIWNDHVQPPWGSNYTININTEMNYWPAERTNLAECHVPLLDFVGELGANGRRTAEVNYGIKEGWVAHHNSDLWAKTSPVGNFDKDRAYSPQAFAWQMGGAWLSTHLWEHYQYGRDIDFLREQGYPLMKGAAQFLLAWLVEDPESGYLITAPSTSPENQYRYEGNIYSLGKGTAMDMAIIRDQLRTVLQAAILLDLDADFQAILKDCLKKIYPYQIGRLGQIQEWYDDVDDPKDTHRHISHLYGLFPGNEIDPLTTPELAEAAKVTLEHRGDAGTGWSMGWKINWWARLRDGDRAYRILEKAFNYINPADKSVKSAGGGGTYPNLFGAHPPFQIDGNFGATAGMTEMLLQSHNGVLDILPALPHAWPGGEVKGIKARGNFEVDISWKKGLVERVVIKAVKGGTCQVRSNRKLSAENGIKSQERGGYWYLDLNIPVGKMVTLL